MRALVVHPGSDWSVSDVYRGWSKGLLANGVDIRPFNLNERLSFYSEAHLRAADGNFYPWFTDPNDVSRAVTQGLHAACYQWRPDVVFVVSARFLPAYAYDVIRERGSKVVIIHTESPYEDERQLITGAHADLNLVNDPLNIDRFRAIGPAEYVPHAYDPDLHRPGPSRWRSDVAWVGTAGDTFPSRTRFMEQVEWGDADVLLAGLWDGLDPDSPLVPHLMPGGADCIDNDDEENGTVAVLRGTKVTFNLYRSAGDLTDDTFVGGWAMGPREVEALAIGALLIRHSPPDHGGEGDEVLPMVPTFTEPGELSEILRHYLHHDEARERIAAEARAAIAGRTFERHAAHALRLLGV